MRRLRRNGLSVAEAVVAVAVMAMVIATATILFRGAAHSYVRTSTRVVIQRTVTTVADLLANDGRHAASYTVKSEDGMTKVLLQSLPSSGLAPYEIEYVWDPRARTVRRTLRQGEPLTTVTSDAVASGVTMMTATTAAEGRSLTVTLAAGERETRTAMTVRVASRFTPSQPVQGCYYSATFWKNFWPAWGWGIAKGSGQVP